MTFTKSLPTQKIIFRLHARDFILKLGSETKIMGIVNVTPDSFSQDGCMRQHRDHVSLGIKQAQKFIRQGAHIIDIGGESSRPGSKKISLREELRRILPIVKHLTKRNKVPISVDTYKSSVAKQALDAGASIINNIKGTLPEKPLLKMVRNYNAAIVLMHIRGTPRTMQKRIHYNHLIPDIIRQLKKSIENCLEIGIKSDKIIIDPGIGFGKTVEHNLEIINRLENFRKLNCPILIGTSRKSFIGNVLGKDVQNRVMGTATTVCISVLKGAHIVRVHDVSEIVDCCKMTDAIINI